MKFYIQNRLKEVDITKLNNDCKESEKIPFLEDYREGNIPEDEIVIIRFTMWYSGDKFDNPLILLHDEHGLTFMYCNSRGVGIKGYSYFYIDTEYVRGGGWNVDMYIRKKDIPIFMDYNVYTTNLKYLCIETPENTVIIPISSINVQDFNFFVLNKGTSVTPLNYYIINSLSYEGGSFIEFMNKVLSFIPNREGCVEYSKNRKTIYFQPVIGIRNLIRTFNLFDLRYSDRLKLWYVVDEKNKEVCIWSRYFDKDLRLIDYSEFDLGVITEDKLMILLAWYQKELDSHSFIFGKYVRFGLEFRYLIFEPKEEMLIVTNYKGRLIEYHEDLAFIDDISEFSWFIENSKWAHFKYNSLFIQRVLRNSIKDFIRKLKYEKFNKKVNELKEYSEEELIDTIRQIPEFKLVDSFNIGNCKSETINWCREVGIDVSYEDTDFSISGDDLAEMLKDKPDLLKNYYFIKLLVYKLNIRL